MFFCNSSFKSFFLFAVISLFELYTGTILISSIFLIIRWLVDLCFCFLISASLQLSSNLRIMTPTINSKSGVTLTYFTNFSHCFTKKTHYLDKHDVITQFCHCFTKNSQFWSKIDTIAQLRHCCTNNYRILNVIKTFKTL